MKQETTDSRVRLIDAPDESGRTTATLLASLSARLGTLYFMSGAAALGSLIAGFAALGRQASRTAEGARLRRALEAGRPGSNGELLWESLRINEWTATMAPSPLVQELRNDAALLLAPDLEETLALMPIPGYFAGNPDGVEDIDPTFLDTMVGLWAFGSDLKRVVEALAEPTAQPAGTVLAAEDTQSRGPEGSLLR